MPFWRQLNLQDAASPAILQLTYFHNHAMLVLTLVISCVGYIIFAVISNPYTSQITLDAQKLEIIWTFLPTLILCVLAFPSLQLLYVMEESCAPRVTLKAIGHQWYWRYEYADFQAIKFDSYMLPSKETTPDQFRLLEVDNRVVLPALTDIRVLVTAADVIHSWTVPSLGIKADAIPGRLNQLSTFISRPGVFYGQCSEICGANHSFMPIAVEVVQCRAFSSWAKEIS